MPVRMMIAAAPRPALHRGAADSHRAGAGERCDRQLRDLTIPVRAAPSFIVSHDVALTDAPAAYGMFDGYTEILLKPNA